MQTASPSSIRAIPASAGPAEFGLVRRMRAGDASALGEVYDQLAADVLTATLGIAGERRAAERALHDGFVTLWRRIDEFDHRRGDLRAWLTAIVLSHAARGESDARRPTGG